MYHWTLLLVIITYVVVVWNEVCRHRHTKCHYSCIAEQRENILDKTTRTGAAPHEQPRDRHAWSKRGSGGNTPLCVSPGGFPPISTRESGLRLASPRNYERGSQALSVAYRRQLSRRESLLVCVFDARKRPPTRIAAKQHKGKNGPLSRLSATALPEIGPRQKQPRPQGEPLGTNSAVIPPSPKNGKKLLRIKCPLSRPQVEQRSGASQPT